MDNILESIKILINNEELKQNFKNEFNSQINGLPDGDEKWLNYKSFLKDEEILNIFLLEFDINFIEKQIIGYINSSNINTDNISENLPNFIDILILKRCINGLSDEEKKSGLELINSLGNLIQQSFYSNSYNANSKLYQGFKENLTLFKIIFVLILYEIKNEENYDKISSNIKNKFVKLLDTWIYQFISFKSQDKDFSKYLFLISIIGIFIEESDRNVRIRNYNMSDTSFPVPNIFDISINDFYQSEELLGVLKTFGLTFNFLRKIENNKLINDSYKIKILLSILNYGIYKNSELVDFSKLFSKFDEVKIKYVEIIKNIIIENTKIIDNLSDENNGLIEDTINFLLFEENSSYINNEIKNKLIEIIKNKLLTNLTLKGLYWDLYEIIINKYLGNNTFGFSYDNLGFRIIDECINDIESFKFTLKNIDKVLIKKELNKFYYNLVRRYIEFHYNEGDNISIKDIRDIFGYEDKNVYIKDALQKINNEGELIKRGIGNGVYKVKGKDI